MGTGTFDIPTTGIDNWKKGEKWYEKRRPLVNVAMCGRGFRLKVRSNGI
jgi:hypothetical protein